MSTVYLTSHSNPAAVSSPPSKEEVRNQLIHDVAWSALKELAICFAFSAATVFFVVSFDAVVVLATISITVIAVNTLLRLLAAYGEYKCFLLKDDIHPDAIKQREHYKNLSFFLRLLAPFSFSVLDLNTRNILVHELGHAAAAWTMYQGANPSISVFPLEGGVTSFYPDTPATIGRWLGPSKAELIVSAAGAGLAIASSLVAIVASNEYPKDSIERFYLLIPAIGTIVQHIFYAFSAFSLPFDPSHDFMALWVHGIHPLASIAVMVALPILAYLASLPAGSSGKSETEEGKGVREGQGLPLQIKEERRGVFPTFPVRSYSLGGALPTV